MGDINYIQKNKLTNGIPMIKVQFMLTVTSINYLDPYCWICAHKKQKQKQNKKINENNEKLFNTS